MIKVDVRNETASNHYKQTQMGGPGDGCIEKSWSSKADSCR